MERRRFLVGAAGMLAAALAADAQPAGRVPRIGVLDPKAPGPSHSVRVFREALEELG